MKSSVFTKIFFALALVLTLGVGVGAPEVLAQTTNVAVEGLDTVGTATGLGSQDPTIIVAKIIRAGLGFLGIIAIIILMYGGFLWMTAGGSEEKVSRAKRLIINATIGLIIILASVSITQFVLQSLVNATNNNGSDGGVGSDYDGGLGGGSGSVFSVTMQSPTGQVPIRNVVPQITFSKTLDATTVTSENVKFMYGDVEIPGTLSVNGNRISFVPATPCPDPNADRFCFDENVVVSVSIDVDVKSSTGTLLSCTNNLCSSSFTTGSVVDTENPVAQVELPDDGAGVSSDSLVDVQVSAVDDAQVSVADFAASDIIFDSVPATGDDLTNVLISTFWDTAGLLNGSSYRLTATVIDIAGNTDSDSITVDMRPATCFDTSINGIETGLNCGGDSASADYCGACNGSSCSVNDECSSGMCDSGICASLPVINTVTPADGAPGTWVTLSGSGFGNFTSSVLFTGVAGPVAAELASCTEAWSNTQIFVVVPEGAIDGPITVTTSSGKIETTFDDNGPLIADFDVNEVTHPGLCDISPDRGSPNDAVTLSGQSFGGERGVSTVTFGAVEAGSYSAWSSGSIDATVPALADGEYAVAVNVGGIPSNSVNYTLASETVETPSIVSLSPNSGGEGQYLTISGINFGSGTGVVWFEDPISQERVLADTESFPDACSDNYWSDQEITVIVPEGLGELGDYNVIVVAVGEESNGVPFTLTSDAPTPGLCAIEPPNALAGEAVILYGDNFGDAQGVTTFSSTLAGNVQTWSDEKIVVTVPAGAVTGAVVASNADGAVSNPVNFEVSGDGTVVAAGRQAAYAWSFSSGLIPDAPEMIFECSERLLSGVPNDNFDNGVGICVNVAVFASFTIPMNQATLSNITLSECVAQGNDPCDQAVLVEGDYTTLTQAVRFDPLVDLKTNTTYRVTATESMLSADGAPLANPSSWTFVTRTDGTPCRIENVLVAPDEATIRELRGTQDFTSMPVNACSVLRDTEFKWAWGVDPSVARFDTTSEPACPAGNSTCALVQALAEGTTLVTATETYSRISGDATLNIDFTDPYVTNYWPNCTEACVNAEVGASFNTAMSQPSLQAAGAVRLYACANELCTSLQPIVGARATCTFDAAGGCTGFQFSNLNLTPLKFYRVLVDGEITSRSGVALTRTNYAGDYSWTFRVREDASLCAVDRISLLPSTVTVDRVGVQQTFSGEAYGEADSCSVSGQRLSGFLYDWSWEDPIADEDLDDNIATRVAEWQDGLLVDSNLDDIAVGCTSACTAAGSLPQTAVCGDGAVDYGEECEDGNVADADGCSASCLREGNLTASCGNGLVKANEYEDCDDGNTVDGDGCSATCLAEGSGSIGATCGNNDIAVTSVTALAGEECDDGNALRGDGCSNECLFEGSPTLTEIGGAVCGDGGAPEMPAEECEDGNTANGDGCSSSCLFEGASANYSVASTCGDNLVGTGEACDDDNTIDGDGCSSDCLWEGSSTLYSSPSFCGDGAPGLGELAACELGVTGDGKIDPIQVAFVPDEAVLEVDPATQQAVATIEVTEVSSGLSTQATLSLLCSAENDTQCVDSDPLDGVDYGVGSNNCCMVRPEATLFPVGEELCRNAAMYAIFTQEMDLGSFEYNASDSGASVTGHRMYARLDLASTTDGLCPADHTSLAVEPRNLVLKVWNKLVRLVTGRSAKADTGDCVVAIRAYDQTPVGDGTYKLQMHAAALLVANGSYELVIEGDDAVTDTDVTISGVTSEYGVGMKGTRVQPFTVGTEVCALDSVEVLDMDEDSAYVFSQGDEQHLFMANGVSYANGIPQEIDSIDGVYSWNWTSWRAERGDDIVTVEQIDTAPDSSLVTAVGENGDDAVIATATIEDNATGLITEDSVSGSAPIIAFLCENPWPGLFSELPWSDTASGDAGADKGTGWMNYSTMYCRDSGQEGSAEDLPEVVAVRPPITESANVIKEYLYEVGGSSDAIGVRVVSNPEFLSPEAWYKAQGFTGNLAQTEVDGYKAGKDGRTTYVVAPNQSDAGDLYANVYVISYNEGANDQTIDIYNQMLDNFKFAINVDDVAICAAGEEACSSARDRLSRDMRRLTDVTDIRSSVNDYRDTNGVVPTLPAGTFVRSLSSSVWESWNSILGGALGVSLPADPLNDYLACGATGYEAYDAETCINELTGTYVCPLGSQTYHYKSVGETEAYLYADLEYTTGTWANAIEADALDGVTVSIGNSAATAKGFDSVAFCDGRSIYGLSTSCGDGVVGGSEICELGQLGGAAVACTTAGGLAGTRSQVCNASCSGYVDDTTATCIVASCGNGVIEAEAGEDCDDGSLNGSYGFCGNDCTREAAFFCGDGELAGGEACDCGAEVAMSYADARAFGAGAGTCSGNLNGVYAASPNGSCAWDCAGPASYCGDGTIDSGEVCDGEDETWSGKLCGLNSPAEYDNQPCSTDDECGGGTCGGQGIGNRSACSVGMTRVMICDDTAGASCNYSVTNWFNIACTEIGTCGDGTVDPGEACDDGNMDGSDSCTDQCTANVCGDGYVYVGEEQCDEGTNNGDSCDSAYGSSCTACSLSCRYEVSSGEFCGDGEINGSEFCDANDMPYTYYNRLHDLTYGSCATLGAQVTNQADTYLYTCREVGVCNGNGGADYNGDYCESSTDCGTATCVMPTCNQSCSNSCPFTYSSIPLQMTTNQPGARAGEVADFFSYSDSSTSELPNAATIMVPACNVATSLTASVSLDNVDPPTTYIIFVTDLSLTMKNEVGNNVTAISPIKSRLDIAKEAIPVAAEELFDKLGDDAQIAAIGYRGLVRGECFSDSAVACLEDIPIPTHSCDPAQPCDAMCDSDDVCNDNTSTIAGNVPYGYEFDFVGPDGEDELVAEVLTYSHDPSGPGRFGHGTFTYEALVQAKNMFDDIADSAAGDNARYITILLSDGEVTLNSDGADGVSPNPILIAQDFDAYIPDTAGYELYTATIGTDLSQVANMKNWSSNSYDGELGSYATGLFGAARETSTFNGLDYAFAGDSDQEMEAMYEQIVDSIVEIAVTIVSSHDEDGDGVNEVVETSGSIEEGDNVSLPWPENFVCNDLYEQQVPIQISFPGSGKVEVSDVRLNYCSP
ncbi:MAG: IPT/TIG domain-containing protein [Patescibacteria group bacterium]